MKKILSLLMAALLVLSSAAVSFFVAEAASLIDVITLESRGDNGYIEFIPVDSSGNELNFRADNTASPRIRTFSLTPSAYDSRNAECITPPKYQGYSGNCWAFSVASTLESDAILQGIDSIDSADYSEAHFSWFTARSMTDNVSDPNYGEGYNSDSPYVAGGNWLMSAGSLARWNGMAEEVDYPFYPYEIDKMGNYGEENRYDRSSGVIINSAEEMLDAEDTKKWIMEHGGVTAAFYYDDPYFNELTNAYYCDTGATLNHQIVIIGWDDNYSADNFSAGCVPAGSGAWLCKNSWSEYWGDGGYFWLSYYDTTTQYFAGFTAQSADNFDNNYTYNGSYYRSYLQANGNVKIANVFKSKSCEKLSAISLYSVLPSQTVNISVYIDIPNSYSRPSDGTLALRFTETLARSGYHTVSLPQKLFIEPETNFSVVAEYKTVGGVVYFPIEIDGLCEVTYKSNKKESFLNLGSTDSSWKDTISYGYNNVFIQAFTENSHRFTTERVDADCIHNGSQKTYCTACGLISSDVLIPASGHSFGEWSGYKQGEMERNRVNERVCTGCGITESISYTVGKVINIDDLLYMIFERIFEYLRMIFN